MDLQAELRAGLHEMIEQITDVTILQAIYVILEREKKHEGNTVRNDMDAALQASIDRGLQQIENGETISHDEMQRRYPRWLK